MFEKFNKSDNKITVFLPSEINCFVLNWHVFFSEIDNKYIYIYIYIYRYTGFATGNIYPAVGCIYEKNYLTLKKCYKSFLNALL